MLHTGLIDNGHHSSWLHRGHWGCSGGSGGSASLGLLLVIAAAANSNAYAECQADAQSSNTTHCSPNNGCNIHCKVDRE